MASAASIWRFWRRRFGLQASRALQLPLALPLLMLPLLVRQLRQVTVQQLLQPVLVLWLAVQRQRQRKVPPALAARSGTSLSLHPPSCWAGPPPRNIPAPTPQTQAHRRQPLATPQVWMAAVWAALTPLLLTANSRARQ
jgi:hypothetical protein